MFLQLDWSPHVGDCARNVSVGQTAAVSENQTVGFEELAPRLSDLYPDTDLEKTTRTFVLRFRSPGSQRPGT